MTITAGTIYPAHDGRNLLVTSVADRVIRFKDVAVGGLSSSVSPLVFEVMVEAVEG